MVCYEAMEVHICKGMQFRPTVLILASYLAEPSSVNIRLERIWAGTYKYAFLWRRVTVTPRSVDSTLRVA